MTVHHRPFAGQLLRGDAMVEFVPPYFTLLSVLDWHVASRCALMSVKLTATKDEYSTGAGGTEATFMPLNVQIRTIAELLAAADALEREAATRYRGLAARMRRQGDTEMAAQFDVLAGMEDRHVRAVADRAQSLLGPAAEPLSARWELPPNYDEDDARGATLGAYQALAFAVRNEERAFAFYTYVAAEAKTPAVRALAEDLARDELEHASILRRHRRRAFRSQRPVPMEIPGNVDLLRASARQWNGAASAAHVALAKALDEAGQTEDAMVFRRLAAEEETAAAGATGAALPKLRNAADGLRILEDAFDRFALIVERSKDEKVVAEAQRLSADVVARLALAGGALRNDLPPPERG
jgi:rubrerythrin